MRYNVQETEPNVFVIVDNATGNTWNWPSESLPLEVITFMTDWLKAQQGTENQPIAERVNQAAIGSSGGGGGKNPGFGSMKVGDSYVDWWDSYSPTGFKSSGGFGTSGPAWDNYNPSGFKSGWHPGYVPQVANAAEAIQMAQGPQSYYNWLSQQNPASAYGSWGYAGEAGGMPITGESYWSPQMAQARNAMQGQSFVDQLLKKK